MFDFKQGVRHNSLTMKTATVRDLRNEFPKVARWIEEGECVEITRSGKAFAHLSPVPHSVVPEVVMPDFLARLHQLFPSEAATPETSSVVDYDRGDR